MIDFQSHRIPNKALAALALCEVGAILSSDTASFWDRVIFAFITGIVGVLCHILSGKAIGMGDIKLIACIALLIGSLSTLLNVLIIAAVMALLWRVKSRTKKVPMAPWFFAGALAVILI